MKEDIPVRYNGNQLGDNCFPDGRGLEPDYGPYSMSQEEGGKKEIPSELTFLDWLIFITFICFAGVVLWVLWKILTLGWGVALLLSVGLWAFFYSHPQDKE
jgi:hypothetical protein